MKYFAIAFIVTALLALAWGAHAQQPAQCLNEGTAINALVGQRNDALNQVVQVNVQLAAAQRRIAELEAAQPKKEEKK